MKQPSILVRGLALAVASLSLVPLASAQGGTATEIPDCVLICRPWQIESMVFLCENECLANEVKEEFDLAVSNGDPYIPRFSTPNCVGTTACPFGDESFHYTTGDTVLVGAGLWSTTSDFWTTPSPSISTVEFYVAPVGSVVGANDMASLPWQLLPPPHLDPLDGFWKSAWVTSTFDDPGGYFLRVEMLDATLGWINAYSLAADQGSCGIHSYGELLSDANTMDLSATGIACAGKTATFTTQPTTASTVFTAISLDGDFLPIFGGTVLVDILQQVTVLATPVSGLQANETMIFPMTPGLAGLSVYFQSLAFDSAAPQGLSFSNALRAEFCLCP